VATLKPLEIEIRQLFGKCVWTHKIQEKQADIYKCWSFWLEMVRIVLSALTTSGILAILFMNNVNSFALKLATAIISLISTGVTLYLKKYDLATLEIEHKKNATDWLCLREDYMALITDLMCDRLTEEELIQKRDCLLEKYKVLACNSPNTSSRAYTKACESLKVNMDNTISDEELKSFLPEGLVRGGE